MFWIETFLSAWAIYAIRLLTLKDRKGPVIALLGNACWVSMWIYTKQYGFLFVDVGLMIIYWDTLRKQLKGEW
jgi:hypothetical protein